MAERDLNINVKWREQNKEVADAAEARLKRIQDASREVYKKGPVPKPQEVYGVTQPVAKEALEHRVPEMPRLRKEELTPEEMRASGIPTIAEEKIQGIVSGVEQAKEEATAAAFAKQEGILIPAPEGAAAPVVVEAEKAEVEIEAGEEDEEEVGEPTEEEGGEGPPPRGGGAAAGEEDEGPEEEFKLTEVTEKAGKRRKKARAEDVPIERQIMSDVMIAKLKPEQLQRVLGRMIDIFENLNKRLATDYNIVDKDLAQKITAVRADFMTYRGPQRMAIAREPMPETPGEVMALQAKDFWARFEKAFPEEAVAQPAMAPGIPGVSRTYIERMMATAIQDMFKNIDLENIVDILPDVVEKQMGVAYKAAAVTGEPMEYRKPEGGIIEQAKAAIQTLKENLAGIEIPGLARETTARGPARKWGISWTKGGTMGERTKTAEFEQEQDWTKQTEPVTVGDIFGGISKALKGLGGEGGKAAKGTGKAAAGMKGMGFRTMWLGFRLLILGRIIWSMATGIIQMLINALQDWEGGMESLATTMGLAMAGFDVAGIANIEGMRDTLARLPEVGLQVQTSLGMLQAEFLRLAVEAAPYLIQIINGLTEVMRGAGGIILMSLVQAVAGLMPYLVSFAEFLKPWAPLIGQILAVLLVLSPIMMAVGAVMALIMPLFLALGHVFGFLIPLVASVGSVLSGFLAAIGPVGWAILAVIGIITLLIFYWDEVTAAVQGLIKWLQELWSNLTSWFGWLFPKAPEPTITGGVGVGAGMTSQQQTVYQTINIDSVSSDIDLQRLQDAAASGSADSLFGRNVSPGE